MDSAKNSKTELRIGADFGSGHTGVALLDGENRVLAREVVVHRADLSDTLKTRRENRAMRRRVKSKRRRLRDFRARLAEMKIAPQLQAPEGEGETREALEARVKSVGNRLYALAHRRGWDWAELEELLVVRREGKPPQPHPIVRETDNFLKERVPVRMLIPMSAAPKRRRGEAQTAHARRVAQWQSAAAILAKGERPPKELLPFVRLAQTCLGELAEAEANARKNPDDPELQSRAENIRQNLRGKRENIVRWLDERLRNAYGGELPEGEIIPVRDHLMVRLGLKDGGDAFNRGEIYAPHANRHRDEMLDGLDGLEELLAEAEAQNAARADAAQWRKWKTRARAIIVRQYRKKRFQNRSPGKCAARKPDGTRCGNNLPQRGKVRPLLFEMEARQMLVANPGGETLRNLTADEIADLKQCADLKRGILDAAKWKAFFARFPRRKKGAEGDDEAQTKPDQLRAIAEGPGTGRVRGLCRECMAEKIQLLKAPPEERGDEWRGRWNDMHGETVFEPDDAPPALRQKVDVICGRVVRMLKSAGYPDPKKAPIVHIGVERASFDIAAMSSAKGARPAKKSFYQKKRPRELPELAREQNQLCVYCGETLGLSATVDHLFPKARGGGDSALNRAAMCAACNTLKGKRQFDGFAENALAALRQNNPEKADLLEKNRGKIAANFSAAQQTMFGAKILRGALMRTLLPNPEAAAAPVIRGRDTALLRERWFPNTHRIKSAMRAPKDQFVSVESGHDLEWPEAPDNGENLLPRFIRQSERNGAAGMLVSPNEGDEGRYWIRLADGETILRLAVRPSLHSLLHEYHHAVDAIVAAAKVDWQKIARMERDIRDRSHADRRAFWQQAESGRPQGELAHDGEPPDDQWLHHDARQKGGAARARTRRQPMRAVQNSRTDDARFLVQRKTLPDLARADLDKIPNAARLIREALRRAWDSIDKQRENATDEGDELNPFRIAADLLRENATADNETKISPAYFLALPQNHILNPKNTRSVSLQTGVRAELAFPVHSQKNPDKPAHSHLFIPESPIWAEVAVWREKDKRGREQVIVSRRRHHFYIRPENKRRENDLPEWENGEPPKNAVRLRRDDKVRRTRKTKAKDGAQETLPGTWRITALSESAMIRPDDDAARQFGQSEPDAVKTENLFWAGQRVTRKDKRAPNGDNKTPVAIHGLWTVEKLRGRAVLSPADDEARRAEKQNASPFAQYQKLVPQNQEGPPPNAQVRRIGKHNGRAKQLWPGLWRIAPSQESARKGQTLIVPDDKSANRAAQNAEKKATYAALIPS